MNLENMTPAEIDALLAPLYGSLGQAQQAAAEQAEIAKQYRKYGKAHERSAAHYEELAAKLRGTADRLLREMEPYEAEYARRGGWSRFFMVMNNGGHLHRTRSCSTCRWTTQFAWLPEYSGQDEAGVVDLAGEDACTVCFPSAPVDRESRLPFRVAERAEREAAAAEKAAKAAKARAAQIVVGRKVYKTQRGAENEAGYAVGNAVMYRYTEARDAEHRVYLDGLVEREIGTAREIAAAIAAQVEGYDAEAFLARKFAAKVKEYRKGGWDIPADAQL